MLPLIRQSLSSSSQISGTSDTHTLKTAYQLRSWILFLQRDELLDTSWRRAPILKLWSVIFYFRIQTFKRAPFVPSRRRSCPNVGVLITGRSHSGVKVNAAPSLNGSRFGVFNRNDFPGRTQEELFIRLDRW